MHSPERPILAFVGGFLGAGKTTLIMKAAKVLYERGFRTAAIMNDQAEGLVDTEYAKAADVAVEEIAGGCFCCRFSELFDSARHLREYQPHIIFAEPVGSCIDISATVLQPFKAFHSDEFQLAPFTVLISPDIAGRVLNGELTGDASYLFNKQIEEADLICLSKSDLGSGKHLPVPEDFRLSGKTGEGVPEWLDELLNPTRTVGAKLLEVDYDRYADAEAALGWLNLHAKLEVAKPSSPAELIGPILDDLDQRLTANKVPIVHLKVFDRSASGALKASICANGEAPSVDGDLMAEPAIHHEFALNLRAHADPDDLAKTVRATMSALDANVELRHLRSFRPARPTPEHRFSTLAQ
jgi:CobW/HypB/UreG, nucleotide-binding domain